MAEYIERDALLEKQYNANDIANLPFENMVVDVRDIEEAPTADVVEVRHGKWNDNIIGFCNVCMECGAIVDRTAIKNNSGELNYCPNCGAKMDGKGDNNGFRD